MSQLDFRPHISVCMAVYNGLPFLKQQINSILSELTLGDELIIVDDGSIDGSRDYIRSIQTDHIHLHLNSANIGVISSFEKALQLSSGEFIFLADQDDVWLPGRIANALAVHSQKNTALVVVNAALIDGSGNLLAPSYFDFRRSGPGLFHNFVKNTYLGCCISFSSSLKEFVLPFPKFIPMHDEWIGLSSEFHGTSEFLPTPLIQYRRHGRNQTALKHSGFYKIMLKRFAWMRMMLEQLTRRLTHA